jgi:hypothetical protein
MVVVPDGISTRSHWHSTPAVRQTDSAGAWPTGAAASKPGQVSHALAKRRNIFMIS